MFFTVSSWAASRCVEDFSSGPCSPDNSNYTVITNFNINNSQTWSNGIYLVTSDLFIKNGGALNISSAEVLFAPGVGIMIETGGTLTVSGPLRSCSGKWKGITVAGGSITMLGAAAAVMDADYGLYCSHTLNGNNSYINLTGGNFQNITNTAITIDNVSLSYFNLRDISVTNATIGIDLVNAPLLYTEGSSFNNCSTAGIQAMNTAVNVNGGCSFYNCDLGILFHGINQLSVFGGGVATTNIFSNNNRAIYALSGVVSSQGNIYTNNSWGNYIASNSAYVLKGNTYSGNAGGYPEGLYFNGNQGTQLCENNNYYTDCGIFPYGANNSFEFDNNCFNTTWWSINVPNNSTIETMQGWSGKPRANCFNTSGDDIVYNSPLPMEYWVPSNYDIDECLLPVTPGNYTVLFSNTPRTPNCGGSSGPNQLPRWQTLIDNMGCDKTLLLNYILQQITILNELDEKRELFGELSTADLQKYVRTSMFLNYALQRYVDCFLKTERENTIETLNELIESYNNLKFAMSVALLLGQNDEKDAAISVLSPYTAEYSDAELVQSLILYFSHNELTDPGYNAQKYSEINQLESIAERQITQNELNLLERVARTEDVYSGYGRWLHYHLTGMMVEPEIDLPENISFRTYKKENNEPVRYSIYPNPASVELNIELSYVDHSSQYQVVLMDMFGKRIEARAIDKTITTMYVNHVSNGIYILQVIKDNEIVKVEKVIVQH